MSLQNAKRPYILPDVEPVITVAEAKRWERDNDNNIQPRRALVVANRMAEARRQRSAYQRELFLRFANMIGAWIFSPRTPNAPAKVRSDTRC